jgi:hypothetical protein
MNSSAINSNRAEEYFNLLPNYSIKIIIIVQKIISFISKYSIITIIIINLHLLLIFIIILPTEIIITIIIINLIIKHPNYFIKLYYLIKN